MTDEAPTLPAAPHTIWGDNRTVARVMPGVSLGKRASADDAPRDERSHDDAREIAAHGHRRMRGPSLNASRRPPRPKPFCRGGRHATSALELVSRLLYAPEAVAVRTSAEDAPFALPTPFPRASGSGIGSGSSGASLGSHWCSLSTCATYASALGRRAESPSPRRNVVLSFPSSSTEATGRCDHLGNCSATRHSTSSGVMPSFKLNRPV